MRTLLAAMLGAALAAPFAFADESKMSPMKPPVSPASIEDAMRANPSCQNFTNGCEICRRAERGPQCSMPGIACQPQSWVCESVR